MAQRVNPVERRRKNSCSRLSRSSNLISEVDENQVFNTLQFQPPSILNKREIAQLGKSSSNLSACTISTRFLRCMSYVMTSDNYIVL